MSDFSSMKVRPSALFPLVLSVLSFALTIVLVLSGTNPTSNTDLFLFSFNTTNAGTNLLQLSSITPTTAAARTARDVNTAGRRSIIADPLAQNTTSSTDTGLTIAAASVAPGDTSSSVVPTPTASATAAPTLVAPQVAQPTNPTAIPITLISTVFQLILNTLASATPQTFQNIIQLAVATQKTSLGVSPIYSFHVSGICFGAGINGTAVNSTSEFNFTRCVSYPETGSYFLNSTKDVKDYALVAATNVTLPALSAVPSLGESGKSFMDKLGIVVLAVFIISLIGNALSILFSIGTLVMPKIQWIPGVAAGITMLSAQMLQISAFVSTMIVGSITSGVNGSTDISGLTASSGGKFLLFIWIAFISAQMTNMYWMNLWFVKYRQISFKKRARTPQQMQAGYRAIGKEVISDFKLKKNDYDDTEGLVGKPVEVQHWNESYNKM